MEPKEEKHGAFFSSFRGEDIAKISVAIASIFESLVLVFTREPLRPASNAQDTALRQEQLERARLQDQLEKARLQGQLEEQARLLEQLEVANRALEEKIRLQKRREERRKELQIDSKKFNYGITGRSGAGKSSLINALRNIRIGAKVPGTAAVSEIECTANMAAFPHPTLPNLVYWDMPGAGTLSSPIESYYEDYALDALDAVIIVVDGKLQQIDVEIAGQAKNNGKHIIFVLSKADMHIKNRVRRTRTTMKEAADSFRHDMMQTWNRELSASGLSDIDRFIVSSYAFPHPETPHTESSCIYTGEGGDASLEAMDEILLLQSIVKIGEERLNG